MVTPNARRNRGQVILIGAITLAFILLGIVVVFNGVLYTETISSSSTSQSTANADVTMDGLEHNLVETAHRGNVNGNWTEKDFAESITNQGFTEQYRTTTSNSRPAIVNMSISKDEYGYAVFGNETEGNITFKSNKNKIEHLILYLDESKTDKINISPQSESDWVKISSSGDGFEVEDENSDCGNIKHEIVRFNLIDGTTNVSGSCESELSIIDRDESYSGVVFESGDKDGKYDIVVQKKITDPNSHTVVREFDTTITYESNQVSYERNSTIKVYGDSK